MQTQLVDIYKRGRAGYAKLLLGSSGVREFGRATRAIAALMRINEQRVAEHRRTIEALQQERVRLEEDLGALQAREADARQARAAADRALAARTALVAQIDERRDLNAQLAGELQTASVRLCGCSSRWQTSGRTSRPSRWRSRWRCSAVRLTGRFPAG